MKIGDVPSWQVSLAVVRMRTIAGLTIHGDQAVNDVGCDVVSAASVMLFNKRFRAVDACALVAATGALKGNMTRHTSKDGFLLEKVRTSCSRLLHVLQQGIVGVQ